MTFREAVLSVVRGIPEGEVLSYRMVAEKSGYPGSARAVGNLMKQNVDVTVPCHRVIQNDGRVGAYNRGGAPAKIAILKNEGVIIRKGRVIR